MTTTQTQLAPSSFTEISIPAPTFDYETTLKADGLQEGALEIRRKSYGLGRENLYKFVEFSGGIWNFYEEFCRKMGPRKAEAKFNEWLRSETFGIPKNMLSLAKDFAPWFLNLAKPLQDSICRRAAELTVNIFKKFIATPLDIVEKLFASDEKITLAAINKELAAISSPEKKQLKLRKKGYAQVITPGHRLEGKTGQVVRTLDEYDNIFLQFFPNGPEEGVKLLDVKPVPKPTTQEADEKDQKIKYYEALIESGSFQQEDLTPQENTRSEEEIEQAVLAKLEERLEREKADEIALIQANADKEKEEIREQARRREQELQQQILEKQQEEFRLQAQRLEAAEAEAKQWQERVQDLEKIVFESQANKEETAFSHLSDDKTTSMTESPQKLSNDLAAALELTAEQMITTLMEFEFPGWEPDGYRAKKNNRIYPAGPVALKLFLNENYKDDSKMSPQPDSAVSPIKISEYSQRPAANRLAAGR